MVFTATFRVHCKVHKRCSTTESKGYSVSDTQNQALSAPEEVKSARKEERHAAKQFPRAQKDLKLKRKKAQVEKKNASHSAMSPVNFECNLLVSPENSPFGTRSYSTLFFWDLTVLDTLTHSYYQRELLGFIFNWFQDTKKEISEGNNTGRKRECSQSVSADGPLQIYYILK